MDTALRVLDDGSVWAYSPTLEALADTQWAILTKCHNQLGTLAPPKSWRPADRRHAAAILDIAAQAERGFVNVAFAAALATVMLAPPRMDVWWHELACAKSSAGNPWPALHARQINLYARSRPSPPRVITTKLGRLALDPKLVQEEMYAAWRAISAANTDGARPRREQLADRLALDIGTVDRRVRLLRDNGVPWPPKPAEAHKTTVSASDSHAKRAKNGHEVTPRAKTRLRPTATGDHRGSVPTRRRTATATS